MKRLLAPVFACFLMLTASVHAAGLDGISTVDASAGVKEALAKGADFAVASLGKDGGFLGNSKVKIPLPSYLQKAEQGLRMFGMGKQADQLIETMNHAAENAVAEAKKISYVLDASQSKGQVIYAKGGMNLGSDVRAYLAK